jgi:putative membrane protein
MKTAALALCAFVAFQHVLFLVIEMFLWRKPLVLKMFKMTQEVADSSAPLAMNQGLYNGFLAAGLVWGIVEQSTPILTFFLGCVVVAGIFGGLTAKATIILVQGVPGAVALALVRIGLPVVLVAALASLSVAEEPAARTGTYHSSQYGFSIDAPSFPNLGGEEQATIVELPAPATRAPSSVSVTVEVRAKYTFERAREVTRVQLDKKGLHVREEKSIEVSGRKALLFRADGPLKGTETTVLELVVLDAPRIYRAIASARTEDWKRDEAALRAAIESFKLDEKK